MSSFLYFPFCAIYCTLSTFFLSYHHSTQSATKISPVKIFLRATAYSGQDVGRLDTHITNPPPAWDIPKARGGVWLHDFRINSAGRGHGCRPLLPRRPDRHYKSRKTSAFPKSIRIKRLLFLFHASIVACHLTSLLGRKNHYILKIQFSEELNSKFYMPQQYGSSDFL